MANQSFTLPPLPPLLTTTVFGLTIRYYDVGSGPTLVLIHGIGGDADDWSFCLDALAASHRVIALDLPGFGRSDKPLIDYTIAGFVEVLDRFLLVGHSLGGWIAATFALQAPQKLHKLVLVDAAGVWGETTKLPVDLHVSTLAHMRDIFRHLFYDQRFATDALIEMAYRQHLQRNDGYTIHSVLEHLRGGRERLDEDERIGQLRVPTLIVWGEEDEMIPLAIGRRIHQLVPASQLEVLPRCGHLPNLEKPSELVRCLLEFAAE